MRDRMAGYQRDHLWPLIEEHDRVHVNEQREKFDERTKIVCSRKPQECMLSSL